MISKKLILMVRVCVSRAMSISMQHHTEVGDGILASEMQKRVDKDIQSVECMMISPEWVEGGDMLLMGSNPLQSRPTGLYAKVRRPAQSWTQDW